MSQHDMSVAIEALIKKGLKQLRQDLSIRHLNGVCVAIEALIKKRLKRK